MSPAATNVPLLIHKLKAEVGVKGASFSLNSFAIAVLAYCRYASISETELYPFNLPSLKAKSKAPL